CCAHIAVTAGPLVRLLYGPDYMPAATVAVLFCGIKYTTFIAHPLAKLILARGKPALNNIPLMAQILAFVAAVFPLTARFGLPGMVIAVGMGWLLELATALYLTHREIAGTPASLVAAVARPAVASLLMGAGVVLLERLLAIEGSAALLALVPGGVVLYLLFSIAFNRPGWKDATRLVVRSAHT
ncbi:MAG: hypothetical protein R6X33_11480, partial [Candidatus Brocadiia bacterium]